MSNNQNNRYVQIGALWIKENKDGSTYMSAQGGNKKSKKNPVSLWIMYEDGTSEEVSAISFMENKYKTEANHPDYIMSAKFSEE